MIIAALLGLMIGYVLAIPPGPISFAAMRTALRQGWTPAVKLAMGAGLFDILYCLMAMLATSAVASMIVSVSRSYPGVTFGSQLMIVGAMIAFGIIQFRSRDPRSEDHPLEEATPSGWLARIRSHGPFFVGVGFAIANLANPTFVPALAALGTFMQQSGAYEPTIINAVIFSIAFGVGQALWLLTLVRLLLRHRDRLTPTFVQRMQQAAGIVLIMFGTAYALRILMRAEWSTMLRSAVAG